MTIDWNAMLLLVIGGVGYLLRVVIDSIKSRYEAAQLVKQQRETREERFLRSVYEWREHAYAVRKIAIDAGVLPDELPEKPDSDDS